MNRPPSDPAPVRRRPVLMAFGGALTGLGITLLFVHFGRIALGTDAPYVVVAIGAGFGVALAFTLPPRATRQRRPGA
jgi:hypothetical protein